MATLNTEECVQGAHLLPHQENNCMHKETQPNKHYQKNDDESNIGFLIFVSQLMLEKKCCYYNKQYLLACVDLKTGVLTTTTTSPSCDSHQQKHQKRLSFYRLESFFSKPIY